MGKGDGKKNPNRIRIMDETKRTKQQTGRLIFGHFGENYEGGDPRGTKKGKVPSSRL